MMNKHNKKIVLIGAGPLGLNAVHIIQQQGKYEIVGFIDSKKGAVAGIEILGNDSELGTLRDKGIDNAVVCIGDPKKRIAISNEIKSKGFNIPTLIHPAADVGLNAEIGEGTIIFHNVFVGPETVIGPYCVVEAGVFIGHNVVIREGVLLSARAVIGNSTSIGRCSTFKIAAGCINKLQIGHNCVVGEFKALFNNLDDGSIG